MKQENKTEYSFSVKGTIVDFLIIGFAIYGVYSLIMEIVKW